MIENILGGDAWNMSAPAECCCCCNCSGKSNDYRIGGVDGSAFYHSYKSNPPSQE